MLLYNPQHVLSSTLLILRKTNCIITASGIVTLCKRRYSMPVESGLIKNVVFNTFKGFMPLFPYAEPSYDAPRSMKAEGSSARRPWHMEAGSVSSQLRLPVTQVSKNLRLNAGVIFQRHVSAALYCYTEKMLFGSKTRHEAQYLLLSQKGEGSGGGIYWLAEQQSPYQKLSEHVEWYQLAQNSNPWRVLVDMTTYGTSGYP